jgi:hypothetical protein
MNLQPRPAYIDRCGEQVFVPPFTADITDFYGFGVKADHETLNANICNRFFNDPLGYDGQNRPRRFTALQYVFFVFNLIEKACSTDQNYKDSGVFSYKEAAVWMIIADHETNTIRWFLPYVFVDSPYALHPGREIYGFPKTMGTCGIPEGPEPPELLWIETGVVKKRGGYGNVARLLEVGLPPGCRCSQSQHGKKEDFFRTLLHTLEVEGPEYLEQFGLPRKFAENAYQDLRDGQLSLIFLKEFRDGQDPTHASGLVVQEAESQITNFSGSRIYSMPSDRSQTDYEIAINDVFSHPMRRDLGLGAGQLKCKLAFWMSFGFSLGACKVIT